MDGVAGSSQERETPPSPGVAVKPVGASGGDCAITGMVNTMALKKASASATAPSLNRRHASIVGTPIVIRNPLGIIKQSY